MTFASKLGFILAVYLNICSAFHHYKSNMKSSFSRIDSGRRTFSRNVLPVLPSQRKNVLTLKGTENDDVLQIAECKKDYEFLDCGNLKRLERFAGVYVVRSCPSAIWPKRLSAAVWDQSTNVVYDGSSGKAGKWTGMKNIKDNWNIEFNMKNQLMNGDKLNVIAAEKEAGKGAEKGGQKVLDTGVEIEKIEGLKEEEVKDLKLDVKGEVKEDNNSINDITNINNKSDDNKIVFTLSCSDQGQVGVFPEQQDNWKWISNTLKKSITSTINEKTKKIKDLQMLFEGDNALSSDYMANSLHDKYSNSTLSRKNLPKKVKIALNTPINTEIDSIAHNNNKNNKNNKNKDKKGAPIDDNTVIRKILNGFAYTGGSSLAAMTAQNTPNGDVNGIPPMFDVKVQVVHLDAAKSSVNWAMRNAAASGLGVGIAADGTDNNAAASGLGGGGSADGTGLGGGVSSDNSDNNAGNNGRVESNSGTDNNGGGGSAIGADGVDNGGNSSSENNGDDNDDNNDNNSSSNDNESTTENDTSSTTSSQSARWITDDCFTFLEREIRRGNKYDGLIFDPPAFGRGSNGNIWKLEKDLPVLVEELIPKLLSADPLFVLLSCHDVSWPPERLAEVLSVAMSGVMRESMLANIKDAKKLKLKNIKEGKDGKDGKDNKNNRNKSTTDKKESKNNQNNNSDNNNNSNNSSVQNTDIKSVFLAGGILEYGPMILKPKQGTFQNGKKTEIGNPLPLGGFARWSKIIS